MVYRIRYQKAQNARESEYEVEANSPTEAMVKFRHTYDDGGQADQPETVISICAAGEIEEPVY